MAHILQVKRAWRACLFPSVRWGAPRGQTLSRVGVLTSPQTLRHPIHLRSPCIKWGLPRTGKGSPPGVTQRPVRLPSAFLAPSPWSSPQWAPEHAAPHVLAHPGHPSAAYLPQPQLLSSLRTGLVSWQEGLTCFRGAARSAGLADPRPVCSMTEVSVPGPDTHEGCCALRRSPVSLHIWGSSCSSRGSRCVAIKGLQSKGCGPGRAHLFFALEAPAAQGLISVVLPLQQPSPWAQSGVRGSERLGPLPGEPTEEAGFELSATWVPSPESWLHTGQPCLKEVEGVLGAVPSQMGSPRPERGPAQSHTVGQSGLVPAPGFPDSSPERGPGPRPSPGFTSGGPQ